jgi:hypothetical protein
VISLQSNEKRGDAPFVRRSSDEHHGFCPSPWAEVIYSLAAMPHELIRLDRVSAEVFPHLKGI